MMQVIFCIFCLCGGCILVLAKHCRAKEESARSGGDQRVMFGKRLRGSYILSPIGWLDIRCS